MNITIRFRGVRNVAYNFIKILWEIQKWNNIHYVNLTKADFCSIFFRLSYYYYLLWKTQCKDLEENGLQLQGTAYNFGISHSTLFLYRVDSILWITIVGVLRVHFRTTQNHLLKVPWLSKHLQKTENDNYLFSLISSKTV